MTISTKVIITIIIVLLLGGVFYLFFTAVEDQADQQEPEPDNDQVKLLPTDFFVEEIVVDHLIENGLHTVSGTLDLPDPCYVINTRTLVMESFPEQVRMEIETPRKDMICAQVITPTDLEVRFQASEDAVLSATLNGKPTDLVKN